jgi:uncharacterized protein YpuA (DUF1002 family)
MTKRLGILGLVLLLLLTIMPTAAFAADETNSRVVLGADLDADQITEVYSDFGISRGDVKELFVTNKEEREYLDGLVPDERIGHNAISSIYFTLEDEGEGLSVSTNNINWCTVDMYKNALTTAGITDATIIVSAPFHVSGTAALTGIYKAYSDITGIPLNDINKMAATEELVVTGDLAETIGSEQAVEVVNELKKILDQTQTMTDAELRDQILLIAKAQNVSLTEENITQIIGLCRTLEKVDLNELQTRLVGLSKTMTKVQNAGESVANFFGSIKNFFVNIGSFFSKNK